MLFRILHTINFAAKKHGTQTRKLTGEASINHPIAVANILNAMGASTDVIIAGILHDTLEDTDTTSKELQDIFGWYIKRMVELCSEDKSKTWRERKENQIRQIANCPNEVVLIKLADKVDNLSGIANFAKALDNKDTVWEKFKSTKSSQQWYYNNMLSSFFWRFRKDNVINKCHIQTHMDMFEENYKYLFGEG